ncbi:MAG: DMT family transporter, partial [Gemmatimonadota bacterium]|nr:DMT family transporter [Gemmatimonadota bacterium]
AVTFVKYFSTMMDVHTQNFFRYCGASVFLSILVSVAYPGCFKRYLARWRVYFFLGSMVVAFQVCWVNALYRVDPAFVSLLGKVSTPLITVMAFLFYREERKVIRKPAFLAGFAMGMAGVAGVVVGISNFKTGLMDTQLTGIVLLLISSLIWSVYANLVKHILRTENSLQAFTFTCVSATVLFFPFMILRGNPGRLLGASPGLIALVIISGIIGIAGANSCYYLSIKRIGLAKSANLALAQPFLVGVVSFLIFGEILTMVQWIFGAVLLAGCALVISVEGQNDR